MEKSTAALNKILEQFKVKEVNSHFGMKERQIRKRVTEAPSSLRKPVTAEFAHRIWFSNYGKKLPPDVSLPES